MAPTFIHVSRNAIIMLDTRLLDIQLHSFLILALKIVFSSIANKNMIY